MLKLKLQYFGHLMWRTDSLEKTLMLGKIEGGRRRGRHKMIWLAGIINSMDMSLSKLRELWWTGRSGLLRMGLQRAGHNWATELNWKTPVLSPFYGRCFWGMKSQIANTFESWTDLLIVSMPLLFAGLWSFLCSERINLLDTFVSVLECFEQGGAIDQLSPCASFYHHLCQVYWFGWQRTSFEMAYE